jgi:hypothetical protein
VTTRRALTGLVMLGLVASFGYWLGNVWERPVPEAAVAAGCQVRADGRVSLAVEQMANAATITAVGVRLGMPERAVQVALATAMQESKLRNLPHLGARNDHDSVGLFQQRPSQGWGTERQLADPGYATERFYRALRQVAGWQRLRITEAAQRVQRSAFPEAYQQWAPQARVLATALLGDRPGAVTCAVPADPPARGQPAAAALGVALARDWGAGQGSGLERAPAGTLRLAAAAAPGVTVLATDARTGWRYAHWLVAHAAERGVIRVRFADLEWTAAAGTWTSAGGSSGEVLAEVAAG